MKPAEIRQEIAKKGLNLTLIAAAVGAAPGTVGQVINRKLTSTRIASAIAKIINKPFFDVFPEYCAVSPRYVPSSKEGQRKVQELKKVIG